MENYIYTKEQLELLAKRLLKTVDLSDEDAALIAHDLVKAEMRGLSSHGVSRIPVYLRRVDTKCVNPRPNMTVEESGLAVRKLNGDDGFGFVVCHRAVDEAIKLAEKTGIAMVGCTHSTHFGMGALYAKHALEKGYACMIFTNSSPALPVFGGKTQFLGTAPLAFGFPAGHKSPGFLLDMAMSIIARGKIRVAMINNEPIPEGVALDKEGRPTTNAKDAFDGVCLPFGGPKGAGLSMFMDMFAGMFTGSNFAGTVSSLYYNFSGPQNLGHIVIVMRSDLFVSEDEYKTRMDEYYAKIKDLPKAAGFEEILMPGEPEDRKEAKAKADGIKLTKKIMDSLYYECKRRGIECPEVFGDNWVPEEDNGKLVFGE